MFKRHSVRIASVVMLLVLAASSSAHCQGAQSKSSSSTTALTYPLTVTDSFGRQITIHEKPERFISLAPSNTEILFALRLAQEVVGVTTFCNYPPEAKDKEKVGGFSDPNIEKIVSLKPDLVLATSMHKKVVGELADLGINVMALDARSVQEVMNAIQLVARIAGKTDVADEVVGEMQKKIDLVKSAVKDIPEGKRVKAFYLVWDEPIMTAGPNTLLHDLITLAGGVNIANDAGQQYPTYSLEVLVAKNPDVIMAPRIHGGGGLDPEKIKTKTGWNVISAVKNNRIYLLEDDLVSRPGPRIVDGLLEVARALYPERFETKG
ncbi:MAG: ABC transporter substrate-binding protein [Bacillota bacterium]